jgi:hypothetical protein
VGNFETIWKLLPVCLPGDLRPLLDEIGWRPSLVWQSPASATPNFFGDRGGLPEARAQPNQAATLFGDMEMA